MLRIHFHQIRLLFLIAVCWALVASSIAVRLLAAQPGGDEPEEPPAAQEEPAAEEMPADEPAEDKSLDEQMDEEKPEAGARPKAKAKRPDAQSEGGPAKPMSP